jgi:hypothetical protein
MALVGMVLGVVGFIAFSVDGSLAATDEGGQQLVDLLKSVGCIGGPVLVGVAGYLYYTWYREYR